MQYIGEDVSPAAKKNGYCHLTRNTIKIKCFGNRVPAYFQIDTSRLNIGVKLRVDVLEPTPYGIAVNEKVTFPAKVLLLRLQQCPLLLVSRNNLHLLL